MISLHKHFRPATYGFTVLEVVVTMVLLGTLLAVIVPVSKRAVDHQRNTELRRLALIEVSNALERVIADQDNWPAAGEERDIPLQADVFQRLERPQLVIKAMEVSAIDAEAIRFDASLTWESPQGGRTAPLTLSAFAFVTEQNEGPANDE